MPPSKGVCRTVPFYILNRTVPFHKRPAAATLGDMDPRIRRTRETVLRAALQVLAERGFANFAMEVVAAAAGVSKSTLYRHWPTKLALLRDALEELNRQPPVELEGGTAREQIERLLTHLTAAMSDSLLSACIPALIEASERHPDVAEFLHGYSARRRSRLTAVVRNGIDAGELPSHLDADMAALALSGPIFYCRLMTSRPLQAKDVRLLIRQVLGPAS
jgi:TetR/AcrR family transcriptional regulator, regulator of autoinduction and epiphytic fitness